MVKVKICGITNLKDAKQAVASGADALGFVFAKSPRKISVSKAAAIRRELGPFVATVGVFVNESPARIKKIAAACGLSAVQLHGNESPAVTKSLKPLTVIKAFRVAGSADLNGLSKHKASAFLFDTKVKGAFGGTGKSFDWKILKKKSFAAPVILSGGLNPVNVGQAVRMVRPFAVDASSGVEKFPGKKDPAKVKAFIQNAKKV